MAKDVIQAPLNGYIEVFQMKRAVAYSGQSGTPLEGLDHLYRRKYLCCCSALKSNIEFLMFPDCSRFFFGGLVQSINTLQSAHLKSYLQVTNKQLGKAKFDFLLRLKNWCLETDPEISNRVLVCTNMKKLQNTSNE